MYICEDKDLEAGFRARVLRAPIAELEILATVDEIEVLRLRGAPDPRNCRRNQGSEASRSSRSGTPRGHASEMGGFSLEVLDEIELRKLRGATGRR